MFFSEHFISNRRISQDSNQIFIDLKIKFPLLKIYMVFMSKKPHNVRKAAKSPVGVKYQFPFGSVIARFAFIGVIKCRLCLDDAHKPIAVYILSQKWRAGHYQVSERDQNILCK